MKRAVCAPFAAFVLWCMPAVSTGQAVFGVKPSFGGVQSAYFGFSLGSLVPQVGVDMLRLSGNAKSVDLEWYRERNPISGRYDGPLHKSYEQRSDVSGSALLVVPHGGFKLAGTKKPLRPYIAVDAVKSFAFVNLEWTDIYRSYHDNGNIYIEEIDTRDQWTRREYNDTGRLIDSEIRDKQSDTDEEDAVTDFLSFWGGSAAIGAEYFLSEHFSVSGEWGVRMIFTSTVVDETNVEDFDGNNTDDWREEWQNDLNGSFNASYAVVGLNFYF